MVKEERSAIARVSEEAWRFTEKLCALSANTPPPAPLEEFAKELGIRCVRFKPLLSDGALAKEGKDLEIVLNTEAPGAAWPAGTVLPVDDGKWGALNPPLRFSVAHEIAHAVFLKVAGYDSRLDLFQKNERAVENACNILLGFSFCPGVCSFARSIVACSTRTISASLSTYSVFHRKSSYAVSMCLTWGANSQLWMVCWHFSKTKEKI